MINKDDMRNRIKIGLVQINNSFSGQNYLPYSVGILQAYAQKYLMDKNKFEFLSPIYKRIPINIAVEELLDSNIIFFSTYVWNIRISLEIAKRVKHKNSDIITVFGGPQVPNISYKNEEFLRKNRFIDISCIGEGEKAFLCILNSYDTMKWKKVPSISYIDNKGRFLQTKKENISDLSDIPSPYIEGIFDPLIHKNSNEKWIVLLETNRGCPFSCSYCAWGTKNVRTYDIERIYHEIDWFSKYKIEFIFCCDANFGILDRDIDIIRYLVDNKKKYGYPKSISIQNTKNSTIRIYDIYKLISDVGLNKGVSLSLQSTNRDTLKSIGRENISIDTFQELQKKFNEEHIETFTDMIIGLPCETYDTFTNGISSIIENGQYNRIQFNNLSILTNSKMDELEYQKKYGLDIQESRLINIHGSLDSEEIEEIQRLVVGTRSMCRNDWIKARVFGWMVSLLFFDKLLQIPFVILHKKYKINYRDLIENFMFNDKITFPILSYIYMFFVEKAKDIQNGGTEYCKSKEWLNIWWPADEFMMIKLCTENKLSEFYKEVERLIIKFLEQRDIKYHDTILYDTIILNQNLIKVPFQNTNIDIELAHNIFEVYNAALNWKYVDIIKGEHIYRIYRTDITWPTWNDWCKYVIWYGNKKGEYLYNCRKIS